MSKPTGPMQSCGCADMERIHAELVDYCDELGAEIERLRARTHEIQAQEMAKRAALDSEIAEWRQRYDSARQWTEAEGLTAEWASGKWASSPFWGMTSYNARSALMRLVTERDAARVENERLRAELRRQHETTWQAGYDAGRAEALDAAPAPAGQPTEGEA